MIAIEDKEFVALTSYIKQNFGINLTQKKSLVECRLSSIIVESGFKNFGAYFDYVFADTTHNEMKKLIAKITTNHTYFMRESTHFSYFKENVLPEITKNAKDKDLRIWSAGCSTGEEPYTLAMLLDEYFGDNKKQWDTKILATDISSKVLDHANKGIYTTEQIETLSPLWKMNYFTMLDKGHYEINKQIKAEVIFRSFNLMQKDLPFKKKFNVIFCRNVMIYFDHDTKVELIRRFYEHTEVGGYLFIGHSESINRGDSNYKYILPAVYRKG